MSFQSIVDQEADLGVNALRTTFVNSIRITAPSARPLATSQSDIPNEAGIEKISLTPGRTAMP
ncbi:hypothetical protein D3C71_2125190 [compost metagenome]